MKKVIKLFLVFLISLNCASQGRESSTIGDLNTQLQLNFNSDWISDLVSYRKGNSHPCYTSDVMNDIAKEKASYFSSVIDESSLSNNFSSSIKFISHGKEAHSPLFGNPEYFKNDRGIDFPVPNRSARINHRIEISGEIMQEMTYFKKSKNEIPNGDLIDMMIQKFEKDLGESQFIKRYLLSPSHKKIIDDYSNDLFGTSTVFVIHKWYDYNESLWCYDVLLLNVTVFGHKTSGTAQRKISGGIF